MVFIVGASFTLSSCSKEDINSTNQPQEADKIENLDAQKSTYFNVELVAMAGNVEQIKYISGNQYEVYLYGNSRVYTVDVDIFELSEVVRMRINDGSTTSVSIIDVANSEVNIQNDAIYSFASLDNGSLSVASSDLFKITLAVVAHHDEQPSTSAYFMDNGSSDIVPVNGGGAQGRCFWCTTYPIEELGLNTNLCAQFKVRTRLWGLFSTGTACGDPFDCGSPPEVPNC